MATAPALDPAAMLRVLRDHGVRFVVIGGLAAIYHGAAHVTFDLDVTPQRSEDNLRRLSDVLRELGAGIRAEFADGIRSKAAADRPKDHLALPALWRLLEAQGDGGRDPA